ncbi:MAG: hypothetical protein ABSF54_09740 [Bryobacteraceae bacterium]|jgi:hypothetical protein
MGKALERTTTLGPDLKPTRPAAIAAVACLAVLIPFAAGIRLAGGPVWVYRPHPANAPSSPGLAFGGPYYGLPPGNYTAVFEVRQAEPRGAGPVARLEVILYDSTGVRSVSRDIAPRPDTPEGSRDEAIDFDVSARSVVETRIFHYGSTALSIGEIRVWPHTHTAPGIARTIAWTGSLTGVLILAGLWLAAPKLRRIASLVSGIYFSALALGIVTIIVRAAQDEIRAPVSEPLLPVVLWIPALLLGGLALSALLRGPSHAAAPALLAGQMACGPAVVLALGWISWNVTWLSISAIALALWAAEICLALALFAQDFRKGRPARIRAIAAYVFVGLFLWYEQYPVSGDQGSYLTETAALAGHRTFNVLPVLASGEFRSFAPYTSADALHADTLVVDGVPGYPARDPGVSLLSIPGYLLGRLKGARIQMELLAIVLAVLVFELLRRSGVRHSVAVFAWAATCFSLPLLHYSSQIYPELCGALLTTLALLQLRTHLTSKCILIAGICAGLLPLFNARYWLLACSILMVGAVRLGRDCFSRKGLALLAPVLAIASLAIAVDASVYHLPLPNAGYFMILTGTGVSPTLHKYSASPFNVPFYEGWLGLWLDRDWGLFSTAPIFVLVPAGLIALWTRARLLAVQILAIGTPYFLTVASYSNWRGGPTATPRYLLVLIPLLAVPVAAALEEYWSPLVRVLAGFLAALGGLAAAASIVSLDSDYVGARLAAYSEEAYGFTIGVALPTFRSLGIGLTIFVLAWTLAIVIFPLVVRLYARSRRSPAH